MNRSTRAKTFVWRMRVVDEAAVDPDAFEEEALPDEGPLMKLDTASAALLLLFPFDDPPPDALAMGCPESVMLICCACCCATYVADAGWNPSRTL